MNKKTRFLLALSVVIVITAAIFGISAYATDDLYDSTNVLTEVNMANSCPHSVYFTFNETNKTITEMHEDWKVESLIYDVETFSGDGIKVYDGEKEVTEGFVKDGMIVQIFHKDKLFGEYRITNLLPPLDDNVSADSSPKADVNNSIDLQANDTGFILPIRGIKLKSKDSGGNISQFFDPTHRGIDIAGSTIYGSVANAEIFAIADGTVKWVQVSNGETDGNQAWGNCVRIEHANGMESLYAHMVNAPTLTVGSTIKQGTVVGRVGDTGNSEGIHLHLEIFKNGNLVNPLDYLTEDSSKNGWYRENGNTYYYENGLTKRGWWHLRSSSYYFDPDTGVMATGFTKIDTHYYYFYPSGDFDGTRGQLLTGWLDIYDNGELRYFYPDGMWDGTRGRMMYGFQPINGSTYFLDPDTGIMTKGWKAYPDSSSIYFFGDDGVMRTGWYHRSGSSTCHYFYPSTGKMVLGLQEIEGHTFYFYTSGMWDGTRGQAMLGWQTVNGGLRYFYPSGDFDGTRGRMLHGFQTINGNTYFLDPDTGIRTVGWRAYPNSSSIYYFDEDGIMQTGWWHYTGKTTLYYFYDDGQLATGFTKLANGYYYFYPDGMWDGTRGQLMIGWQKVDGEWRYFYENGEYEGEKGMMHTYWLTRDGKKYFCDPTTGIRQTGLLNYPQGSTDYYYFDENGVMQTGSVNIDGKLYYFDKSTGRQVNYIFGWLDLNKDGSEIYFFNADHSLATGWITSGSPQKVYYYDPDTGKMATGMTTIGKYKYLFKADGALNGTRGQMIVDWYEDSDGVRFFYGAGTVGEDYGHMVEGFFVYYGKRYYFNYDTGLRASGWTVYKNGKYIYCSEDGVVYTGWYKTDDGKTYYFDMIFAYLATGYTRIGKDSYFYFNPDGEPGGTLGQLMTGSIKVEDKLYFFDRESGLRVSTPGWYDVNGDGSEVYYIKDDFSLATGWLTIPNDNNTYYFDPDTGKMVSEKTVIG